MSAASSHAVHGLMLSKIPYGDKGHILKIWTRPFGVQAYMVHSVRSGKSGMRPALLLPMTALDAVVSHRDKGHLEKVSEVRALVVWKRLATDPMCQALCLFAAEILTKTLKAGDSSEDFFDDVMDALHRWDEPGTSLAMAAVELCALMAHHLGFALEPEDYRSGWEFDLQEGQFCPEGQSQGEFIDAEATAALVGWMQQREAVPTKAIRHRLLDRLLLGLRWHHPGMGEVHSVDVLRALQA